MSKIQDALRKLQSAGQLPSRADEQKDDSSDSAIIAKLSRPLQDGRSHLPHGRFLNVDRDALREAGLMAPDVDEQLLGNQYRDIKRPLIAQAFGKRAMRVERGNLIMVGSALSGEGKTFTSINLALSMARERDYAVLLVDADVAKPQISEMFDAHDEPGLLDVLEDANIPVESVILPTDIERLSVLPAGKPRQNATELLSSAVMERLMGELGLLSEEQLVIFDTPPLLQTSESKVLASLAGQIVLVVLAEETSHDAVSAALESVDADKAVNLVLNQVRGGFGEHQYGYGHGYGYKKKDGGQPRSSDADIFD